MNFRGSHAPESCTLEPCTLGVFRVWSSEVLEGLRFRAPNPNVPAAFEGRGEWARDDFKGLH